jgi:hypothetical protein
MGLYKASRESIGAFGRLACRTGRDMLGDKATHIRPIEISGDGLEGALHTWMASLIVKISTHLSSEGAWRNNRANATLCFTDPQDSIVNHIEHAKFTLCCPKGIQQLLNNGRNFRVLLLGCHNGIIKQGMNLRIREDSIITGFKQRQDVLVLLQ